MSNEEIIRRIKYIRERAGLTQKALSLAVGVNQNYINRLESKKDFEPSLGTLRKILKVCNTSFEELFYEDFENYERDKKLIAEKVNRSIYGQFEITSSWTDRDTYSVEKRTISVDGVDKMVQCLCKQVKSAQAGTVITITHNGNYIATNRGCVTRIVYLVETGEKIIVSEKEEK